MSRKAWDNLKTGSIVRSVKSGVLRRVIKKHKASNTITLVVIRTGTHRRWSGQNVTVYSGSSKTVYASCDKNNFQVYRY